jgi:bacillithiol system protein YtxJ
MKNIKVLNDEKTLQEILKDKKVIIFKNSMNCGISRNARGHMEKFAQDCKETIEIYMVDVINERELSKKIESITGIKHESPQAIYLENGKIVWQASHYMITVDALKKAVDDQG